MSLRQKASVENVAERSAVLDRLRQPDYTGRNRCIPCTIVNLVIAIGVSAAIGVAVYLAGPGLPVAIATAGLGLGIATLTIYLRGYLVPYTPTLTKRYLPERVLKWFDKDATDSDLAAPEQIDVERLLLDSDLLENCEGIDDWCLETTFRVRWKATLDDFDDEGARRSAIADLLDVDPDRLDVLEFEKAAAVRVDGREVGQWESDAAFKADLAADRVLPEYVDGWTSMHPINRSRVLNSLRMFLQECPACGESVTMGQEQVESCCRSFEVIAVTCESCDSRLFEIETSPELVGAT